MLPFCKNDLIISAIALAASIPGSQFLLIKGKAGHYVFLNEAAEPVKKNAPVYFTDDPTVDRHKIHQQVSTLAVEFFKKNLK